MLPANLSFVVAFIITCSPVIAQPGENNNGKPANMPKRNGKEDIRQMNFFIVSKPKKTIDLASWFNIGRSTIKSILRPKKFVAIVARDARQMSAKVQYQLRKHHASIGTIWFDSHGLYKRGYSLFYIGKDEFNYQSIHDCRQTEPLAELAVYTTSQSKVVIGSCYGGATYCRKDLHSCDTIRMNGDSLMKGLGFIFNQAVIYASESWVMTKPGLFLKKPAVAGHPGKKLFKDVVYRPVWQKIGRWNEYNAATDCFAEINPVTLDGDGYAHVCKVNYAEKNETKRKINSNLQKLKPGLLKIK